MRMPSPRDPPVFVRIHNADNIVAVFFNDPYLKLKKRVDFIVDNI